MNVAVFGILTLMSLRHLAPKPACYGPVEPRLYMSVSIGGDFAFGNYELSSPASTYYSDCWGNTSSAHISGRHAIFANELVDAGKAFDNYSTDSGSWSGWLDYSAVPTHCYF